jgi:hypothetical protein
MKNINCTKVRTHYMPYTRLKTQAHNIHYTPHFENQGYRHDKLIIHYLGLRLVDIEDAHKLPGTLYCRPYKFTKAATLHTTVTKLSKMSLKCLIVQKY